VIANSISRDPLSACRSHEEKSPYLDPLLPCYASCASALFMSVTSAFMVTSFIPQTASYLYAGEDQDHQGLRTMPLQNGQARSADTTGNPEVAYEGNPVLISLHLAAAAHVLRLQTCTGLGLLPGLCSSGLADDSGIDGRGWNDHVNRPRGRHPKDFTRVQRLRHA
jgi:hypothetical protein